MGLLSQKHVFLLSEPGTAKSALAKALCKMFSGLVPFMIQLDKQTRKEAVYGPADLDAYIHASNGKKDYKLLIDGYAACAHLLLIDEIWKAEASILDSFLWHWDESRQFKNGREVIDTPLMTVLCCSNELPEDHGLKAHYDRIMLRYVVQDIQDDSNFFKVLGTKISGAPNLATLDDLKAAQKEVAAVALTDDIKWALTNVRRKLQDIDLKFSVRRWNECIAILQAQAWLDGRNSISLDDLLILQHVLWDKPEDRKNVQRVIYDVASPSLKAALDIFDKATEVYNEACKQGNSAAGNELNDKLKKLRDQLQKLQPRSRKIDELDAKLEGYLIQYATEYLGFKFS